MPTFMAFRQYFSGVFSDVVRGESASLVMMKKSSRNDKHEEYNNGNSFKRRMYGGLNCGCSTRGFNQLGSRQQDIINCFGVELEADNRNMMKIQYPEFAMAVVESRTCEAYLVQNLRRGQKSMAVLGYLRKSTAYRCLVLFRDEIDAIPVQRIFMPSETSSLCMICSGCTHLISNTFGTYLVNASDMCFLSLKRRESTEARMLEVEIWLSWSV